MACNQSIKQAMIINDLLNDRLNDPHQMMTPCASVSPQASPAARKPAEAHGFAILALCLNGGLAGRTC